MLQPLTELVVRLPQITFCFSVDRERDGADVCLDRVALQLCQGLERVEVGGWVLCALTVHGSEQDFFRGGGGKKSQQAFQVPGSRLLACC